MSPNNPVWNDAVFRALIDSAPYGMVVVDHEGRILFVNSQTEKLFGYSRAELLNQPLEMLAPERVRDKHEGHRASFTSGPQQWPMGAGLEPYGQRKDGTEFPVEVSLSTLETEEGILVLSAIRDITERKEIQEVLTRHAADLARSNEELAQFAYVASHDLQEPLRKIVVFGDRLLSYCGGQLDEQGRYYLDRMQNAARRMSQLIESLLELSQVATKGGVFEAVDLNKIVSDVLGDLEVLIQQSGARVEVEHLPILVADRSQMRQLLQNLIGNALKFHEENVPPVVCIRSQYSEKGRCEIHVTDNGIGFEEKYLDRIFRPFQRLHGKNIFEGSGMGLAICNRIVACHSGEITAHSQPGIGSDFVFTLPARPRAKAARAS